MLHVGDPADVFGPNTIQSISWTRWVSGFPSMDSPTEVLDVVCRVTGVSDVTEKAPVEVLEVVCRVSAILEATERGRVEVLETVCWFAGVLQVTEEAPVSIEGRCLLLPSVVAELDWSEIEPSDDEAV